jgi:hypothetical protein
MLITISIFDSADEAFASNEKAADWVRKNVLEFTRGMPEVMVDNALVSVDGGQPLSKATTALMPGAGTQSA